jgi:hypothetical protein
MNKEQFELKFNNDAKEILNFILSKHNDKYAVPLLAKILAYLLETNNYGDKQLTGNILGLSMGMAEAIFEARLSCLPSDTKTH